MKFRFFLFCLTYMLLCHATLAQKNGNIWYFGESAGVDFNASPPLALTDGALFAPEGCATICDKQGRLLFYTNGSRVLNANHQVMPSGIGLAGNPSTTQSAVILQWPQRDSLYFIFTVDRQAQPNGLSYSVINMNRQGGLGDVVTRNVFLYSPTSEKITAVKHANGRDVWIITHKWNSNEFQTYLVTPAGVQTTPLVQAIGMFHGGPPSNTLGYLKSSPSGRKIAVAQIQGLGEVFDFNPQTGMLSNPMTINQNYGSMYGLEFSPNERLLYISYFGNNLNIPPSIYQYDLDLPTQLQVNQSAYPVFVGVLTGALQLTPDRRIFVSRLLQPFLGSIEFPDSLGSACGYRDTAILLAGRNSRLGLPNFVPTDVFSSIQVSNACLGDTAFFSLSTTFGNVDSIFWQFGDPAAMGTDTSSLYSPSYLYNQPGFHQVQLTIYADTITFTIHRDVEITAIPQVTLPPDTSICSDSLLVTATSNLHSFYWSNSARDSVNTIRSEGWYWVEVQNSCRVVRDSIWVGFDSFPTLQLRPIDSLCQGDSLFLEAGFNTRNQYVWDDGSTLRRRFIKQAGWRWVESNNSCGRARDSVWIKAQFLPSIFLGNDTSICRGDSLHLAIQPEPNTSYIWQDGTTSLSRSIHQAGIYWLEGTHTCGITRDSVIISELFRDLSLGRDTLMCSGDSILLSVPFIPDATVTWSDGSTGFQHLVKDSGLFWLEIEKNGCAKKDSIEIELLPFPYVHIGNDTSKCEGIAITLQGHLSQATYLWNTGSQQPAIQVTDEGYYSLTGRNACGSDVDSIWVEDIKVPIADLGRDTSFCEGDTVALRPHFPGAQYLWQDGSTDSVLVVTAAGEYQVWLSNECGSDEDQIGLSIVELPEVSLGKDTSLCWDEILVLETYYPQSQYLWQDGSTSPDFTVKQPGTYILEVEHLCGRVRDTLEVAYEHCDCKVFLATAFSPNEDGHNDVFGPAHFCAFTNYHFQIFNRWGQLIFESRDPSLQWDGRYNMEAVPEGVYTWVLSYGSDLYESGEVKRGTVTLIR